MKKIISTINENDPHHGLPIAFYKNAVFYDGKFFVDKDSIAITSLHNRFHDVYSPLDINTLQVDISEMCTFDKPVLYLSHFHANIGHSMWDSMYPSWYSLLYFLEECWDKDFQWVTKASDYRRWSGGWPLEMLEVFSGNPITSDQTFFGQHKKPIKIPSLVVGTNIGLGQVGADLCVKRQLKQHSFDPVERFVDRLYQRYKIKRKTIDDPEVINIAYIVNKRPYNGIEKLFDKLNKKYHQYCFKVVNWADYNFAEQLEIANTTKIIIDGVGTARANTAFLPNFAIEIQTGQHSDRADRNYICYFDSHFGTFSRYIKTINIIGYSLEEFHNRSCSSLLEKYIDDALEEPLNFTPITNLTKNLPAPIRDLTERQNFIEAYTAWRKASSNNVSDLIARII